MPGLCETCNPIIVVDRKFCPYRHGLEMKACGAKERASECPNCESCRVELAAWKKAVADGRAHYPTDVFPEDGKSLDCKSAAFARGLFDQVVEDAEEAIRAVKEAE